ncbi:mitochondrial-processing peptidase subunit beta [Nomia melanderi]|uniref:mitochondrial-processing peptidase subunit beta n=1 Tax=Nomia melanderi TaxID=2448451 RepID=UPI003FCE7AB3
MVLKYLCHTQINMILKYSVKRGYISILNNYYKTIQNHENTHRKMTTGLDTYLNTESAIESCILSNGIRLVCESKSSYTTTLGCYFPAGSMHEMPEERGSALFLEHLLFRRTMHKSKEELTKAVEEIGAKITTVASRDMFLFYGTVPSNKTIKLIDLFADVTMNNVICDQDITREKCIILHELSKMELDKERVVMDYLPTIAYQDTDLASSIYPETDIIKTFCKGRLTEFQSRLFKPCFMTIVSVGPICLQELERIVCRSFMCEKGDCNTIQSFCTEIEYRFSGAELRFRDDDDELGYVAIGIEGPSSKQCADNYALAVAKEIVGYWDRKCSGAQHNAPYIAHCAYNTDLCHMYKSFFQNWAQSTSIWGCYFVCNKLSLMTMTKVLQKEWMRLCTTVTQKEVLRAVNQCKTKELLLLNDPVIHFLDIVKTLLRHGHYIPIHERIIEYEKITADKLREVSIKYIYNQNPAVIALGRTENLPDYCNIRNGMYLLRY